MRRGVRAAVAVMFVAGTVSACGGGGASAATIVAGAPAKTTAAKTAAMSETVTIVPNPSAPPNPALGKPQVIDGKIDFAARRGELTFHLPQLGDVRGVLDGSTVYENIPAMASETGGKPWLKIDLETLGQRAGIQGLGSLIQSQNADPTSGLQYLRGLTGTPVTVGKEKVRGVVTTHYRGAVDVRKAADALPPEQQATMKQITEQFGIATFPVDAWVDNDGRIRRVHFSFDYSSAKGTATVPASALPKSAEFTIELYNFGTPVSVSIPPADQTVDILNLLSGATGAKP